MEHQMNVSILRVNKSTAKRTHLILLLPFIVAMVKVKIFITAALLSALFCTVAFSIYMLCKKHLSVVVAYPISITVISMLTVLLSRIPDFAVFSFKSALIPSVFLTLFIYKYIGAVRESNKIKTVLIKYVTILIGAFVLSLICELISYGTLLDIKIHNHPIMYFSTYSGVFLLLAFITAVINITAAKKIDINKSFNMKKGSIRLISYSAFTSLIIMSVTWFLNNLVLVPMDITYLQMIIICFLCGASFIAYRLIDKKLRIGKHAANFIPSMTLLFSISVMSKINSYKDVVVSIVSIYAIVVVSIYLCETITMRKSTTDINNPLAGAPSTLAIFSVGALVLDVVKQYISL